MKRLFCFVFIFCIFVSGCVKGSPPVSKNPPQHVNPKNDNINTVSEYFPLSPNRIYTYKGIGNEFASKVTSTEYLKGRIVQQNTNNGGTALSEVFVVGQGAIKKVFSKGESYWREDFTQRRGKEEIILQQPLKAGTQWNSNGKKFRISDTDSKVTVPCGTYKAVKVVTELQDATFTRYFVKNIGIVKEEYVSNGNVITGELAEVRSEPVKMRLELYYINSTADQVVSVKKDLFFYTNDSLADKLFLSLQRPSSKDNLPVVPKSARLLTYDKEDGALRINFSKEFVLDMNAGSGTEGMILNAVVNTFGKAFGVDRVIINIEGKAYESGHFQFNKDESIQVKE